MPPWPFFSNSSSQSTTPPARIITDPLDEDDYGLSYQLDKNRPGRSTSPSKANSSSPTKPREHARKLSNTIFNVPKRKPVPSGNDGQSKPIQIAAPLDNQSGTLDSPRNKQSAGRKQDENDFEAGKCATCDTKVKWPRGVTEFRCGTCLMVNDLKIQPVNRAGSNQDAGTHGRADPITLNRTQAILDDCIDTYLESKLLNTAPPTLHTQTSPTASPTAALSPSSPNGPDLDQYFPNPSTLPPHSSPSRELQTNPSPKDAEITRSVRPEVEGSSSTSPLRIDTRNNLNNTTAVTFSPPKSEPLPAKPSRHPPPPPPGPVKTLSIQRKAVPNGNSIHPPRSDSTSRQHDTDRSRYIKAIFKPLEDYIIQYYANYECLNCSFSTSRPRMRGDFYSEEDVRPRKSKFGSVRSKTPELELSELDAKTLLLGDFAENGMWWTGKDGRARSAGRHRHRDGSPEHSGDVVNSKSPKINWQEVNTWYLTIIRAGERWKDRLKSEKSTAMDGIMNDDISGSIANEISYELNEARLHVRRTLLRASEVLLKRPGRPLKGPNDVRFLLIMLANPLLYPAPPARSISLSNRNKSTDGLVSLHEVHGRNVPDPSSDKPVGTSAWEQGPAFGILKRLLGLLSNLSNECHRALTSWLTRYNEDHFRCLLDLVQGFVTHRLSRQHRRKPSNSHDPTSDFIPTLTGTSADTSAQLHAALGLGPQTKPVADTKPQSPAYSGDWQVRAAARVMALIFAANRSFHGERTRRESIADVVSPRPGSISRNNIKHHNQLLSTSDFYNTLVDYSDLIADFETWESSQGRFSFCQYPFFLSVGSKIRIMEHDARRQMEVKAREAFFNSIIRNRLQEQNLVLKVRRDCLVEDSMKGIGEVVGTGQEEIKKSLRVQFINEEGIDAGGLRKEWFLLLVREIFDPLHGMFIYDDDSQFCYFNPHSLEHSEQFFLVGALLGLAIYNSTILDVALPPFTFKKLLMSGPNQGHANPFSRSGFHYTINELAEYRPALASGLRQLLEYDGNVEETFCRDFVVEVYRYGSLTQVPLCPDGDKRPVTNSNRQEFVDLYIRFLLDTQVARQFEPFKRGFFTVCGGNALSLFQPEEIELLIRGSDEPLDVPSLKAVAVYENWLRGGGPIKNPAEEVNLIRWFWAEFEEASPAAQRKLLGFITGSDRIPAMGAASLVIKIAFAGNDSIRFPIARTCFNLLLLYKYGSRQELAMKLWRAVGESEGFGLK